FEGRFAPGFFRRLLCRVRLRLGKRRETDQPARQPGNCPGADKRSSGGHGDTHLSSFRHPGPMERICFTHQSVDWRPAVRLECLVRSLYPVSSVRKDGVQWWGCKGRGKGAEKVSGDDIS